MSEQVVYSGSSTTSGQPCMTPRQLMESMTQLEEMLRKLEQSIKEVVKDLEKRKQVDFLCTNLNKVYVINQFGI